MIDIKDISGNTRFSTLINEGSKRKFLLMKEDYITLKFSLDNPIYFHLGDGIDNELGIFELTDLYKPSYNESTGGYDYDLRLDAYYWKWKNKKFFYTPESSGREASWNLTATLDVHLKVFIDNLKALGYKFRDQAFIPKIDDTVADASKLVSYNNANLIDALTQMAETWECEWWIDHHNICFGRCEFSSPVDFKVGNLTDAENVNVNSMQRSDSQTTYATRVYAFGSTRNIPASYRKSLIFDVKKVDGRDIADTERRLDIKFFPLSSQIGVSPFNINVFKEGEMTGDQDGYEVMTDIFASSMPASSYRVSFDFMPVYLTTRFTSNIENLKVKVSLYYYVGDVEKVLDIQEQSVNDSSSSQALVFDVIDFSLEEKAENCRLLFTFSFTLNHPGKTVYYTIGREWDKEIKIECLVSSADTSVTFLSGSNAGQTFKSVYNPDLLTGDAVNVLRLPEGVVASSSDRYIINNIIKGKVPDNYFSKDDKELTLNGVVQKRLMLPANIPYVDAYRYSPTGERIDIGDERYDNPDNVEMPKEEAIEEIIILEDEYPKYIGNTKVVSDPTWEDEKIDDKPTGNKYPIYTFKDTGLKNFTEDFRIKGEELRIAFQTGKLAGLDFALNIKESDDTGTTFEIVRNEDYGRFLPDDVLFPQAAHTENGKPVPADTYILHGFDTAFISEQMLPDAEQKLLKNTKKRVKKSMIDPSTYDCDMDVSYIYNESNIRTFEVGDKVNLINKAYFPNGRQSRIIGFEWPLDIPYDHPIYTVGETAAYSRIGEIESKIDSLTYKGQTYSGSTVVGGGPSVYVIGVNDKTLPSDRNVFSAKKALDEFLSSKNDNTAEGLLTLLKGLVSEGLIEANGGLVVRKEELVEAAFMSLFEESEDSLVEELRISSPGSASTLGDLLNVLDAADDISQTNDILVRLAGSSDWTIDNTLLSKVSQLMAKVFPFTMTLSGGGTYEKGSSQTISLSWSYDRDIISQSLGNESLAIDIRSKQYAGVASDTTYTLKAIHGGQPYTKSVSASFRLKKYYGVSASPSLSNDEIVALFSTWAQRTQGPTVFDCTGGKYPYYILPTSMVSGGIQFWIGGLRNTDWQDEAMNVTNAYGYTESYTIFRLNSIQTGVLNIEVKWVN